MQQLIDKAHTLIEALPYIRTFSGKTFVIKYGGSAMVDEKLKDSFAQDVVLLNYVGINTVIVHGGGPQIGKTMERMGKVPEFIAGMRVTDLETMEIVEMVLGGRVNKEIVALINNHGGKAVGLTGKDGRLIEARKTSARRYSEEKAAYEDLDIGHVGEVVRVNPEVLDTLDASAFIPIIAPVGVGAQGESYNINADSAAGAVAAALKAEKLILLTDVPGVLDSNKQLIPVLDQKKAESLLEQGVIAGGMIPKVKSCFTALAGGVAKTHVIDGRILHALLLEIFTAGGIGTEISAG
ncbi:MAG: acetylglutamate kinase [Nitrospirota bacterium]|nr:acetylglutamate kinase [Nitrospirota bacterium]